MGQRGPVTLSFTELLYGVVIGAAVTRISALELTRETVLLLVALVLVFDDYLLYHQRVDTIAGTGRNAVSLFLVDMLVLGAWHGLVLATNYTTSVFLAWVSVFFSATSIWDWLFSEGPFLRRLLFNGDFVLVIAAAALAGTAGAVDWPSWVFLVALGVVFLLSRWSLWRAVWRAP